MAITDGSQSYVVYTYRCGDLQWPGGATIGYNGGPVGNFYQNHPLSGDFANSIACINTGVTEWSNVIYNVSIDMYFPTGQPTTTETGELHASVPILTNSHNINLCQVLCLICLTRA